jgi:hypothetical protein
MNGALLQAKVYAGYAAAALRVGTAFSQYRPAGAGAVLVSGNLRGTLTAAFDGSPLYGFSKPPSYGKPFWYALVDGRMTQPGDYLTSTSQTWFIAAQQPLEPIQAVLCNRVVAISRPAGPAPGASYYGGDTTADETPLLTGWPVAIVESARRGQKPDARLPGDIDSPMADLYLPPSAPVQLRYGDTIFDDQAQPVRYVVGAVETSSLGTRATLLIGVA